MARKLFISFLGRTAYSNCVYYDDKRDYPVTRFIQEATLRQIGADKWDETDAVRIFVTSEAFHDNWDKSNTELRFDRDERKEVKYTRLEQILDDMNLSASVKPVPIEQSANAEEEIWNIFDVVYKQINKGDELYIDITHAFRYQPMLLLVLSNYAKFLKDIEVKHISYGNWEARDNNKRAPIVDLLPLTKLQDWTSAASDFLQYGYAGRLKNVIKEKLAPLLKDNALRTENTINVNRFGTSLEDFVEERITCRGIDIANGKASDKLVRHLELIEDTGITALNPIFEKLKASVRTPSDISSRCYEAAKWCYDKHLYQQAITILQEGINTFFCIRNGIRIDDEARRDYVGRAFNVTYKKIKGEKVNDNNVVDNVYMQSLLQDMLLTDEDVVKHYNDLSGTRNDFNHSGFRSRRSPLKPTQIIEKISKALEFFKPILAVKDDTEKNAENKALFINISNHPSSSWSTEQMDEAKKLGEVIDIPFPNVDSMTSKSEIETLADNTAIEIKNKYSDSQLTVHVMGEMTFTFALVTRLKDLGIRCVASCTDRNAKDIGNGDKISHFRFVQFREY